MFTGAQKVQHQPLAPQLQLNSAYREDGDDEAEFRGAPPAPAPAAPAAPEATAGLAATGAGLKAARAPPEREYDVKPLVIFVCVAAAAALFALSKKTAKQGDMQRHEISTENVFQIFNHKY